MKLNFGFLSFSYVIVYKKGYQDSDTAASAVIAKVKGIAFTNRSDLPNIGRRIWDVADYVVPPQVFPLRPLPQGLFGMELIGILGKQRFFCHDQRNHYAKSNARQLSRGNLFFHTCARGGTSPTSFQQSSKWVPYVN